jgi:hypothetical protein
MPVSCAVRRIINMEGTLHHDFFFLFLLFLFPFFFFLFFHWHVH